MLKITGTSSLSGKDLLSTLTPPGLILDSLMKVMLTSPTTATRTIPTVR